jgi:hypothetical protein
MLDAELDDLVLPVRVSRILPVEPMQGSAVLSTRIRMMDGAPLLIASEPGRRDESEADAAPGARGLIVFLTTALSFEWTDLQSKPLIVPLLQEIVRQGVGRARGASVALAGTAPDAPARSVELRAESGRGIVVEQGRATEAIRRAGIWRGLDESGALRGVVAVNADPAGGRGDAHPQSAVEAWLSAAAGSREIQWIRAEDVVNAEEGGGVIRTFMDKGDAIGRLALPMLIAALVLAVMELFLARWFSHAYAQGRGAEEAA